MPPPSLYNVVDCSLLPPTSTVPKTIGSIGVRKRGVPAEIFTVFEFDQFETAEV